MAKAETPYSREARVFDTTLGARFPNPRLVKLYGSDTMPETGDNVAREQGISREEADRFALRSQERCERARATGFLAGEIAPVEVPGPGKGTHGGPGGRAPAPRDDARGAGAPAAPLRGRRGHRRERLGRERRRRRAARRLARRRRAGRGAAAGADPLRRRGGGGAAGDGDWPGLRHPQGARPRRPHARRRWTSSR